jgi:AraC family transcriptional activator of pobA
MRDPSIIKGLYQAFSKGKENGVLDLDNYFISRDTFNLARIEDLYGKTNGVIPPYRQSDVLIIFLKKGTGRRSIAHYTFDMQDNSLVIIPPRVIQAAKYTSQPQGYFIMFNSDFFLKQAFSYKLLNSKRVLKPTVLPIMKLSQEQGVEIAAIFEKIIEECDNGFEERKQMIALKLLELLILCDRYLSDIGKCDYTEGYGQILQTFNELIENNFTKHREVLFYANALHTHPNNLNHIVKKETGYTAKQTIINRLIIEAKYLLVSTTLSIKEIGYELGFEDANYFISFFKNEQSVTPLKFRNDLV